MSIWIILAVISQFFYAVVAIIDKYIVTSKKVSHPTVLAFYVGILSSLAILIFFFGGISLPFESISIPSYSNVSIPTLKVALLSLLAGFSLIAALVFLFSAFKKADASDVVPVAGSMSAVSSLFLSFAFLGSVLSANFLIGVVILVIGMLLVSLFRFDKKVLWYSILAGAFFGAHFVLLKLVFNETVFDNGFFWSRIAIAVSALFLLLIPKSKRHVDEHNKTADHKTVWFWILGNKVLAGIASILALKAIELGEVSVVQALGALQFAFLLIFAILFGHTVPYSCGENCNTRQKVQKFVSVGVIIIGFIFLFI